MIAFAACATRISSVGLAPNVIAITAPIIITNNQITLNLPDFISFFMPRAPVVANAAARGAVIAEEKPAAKSPMAINHFAQEPRIGSTAS